MSRRPKGKTTVARNEAIIDGYASGLSTHELATQHGILRCRVTQVLRAGGVDVKRGRPRKVEARGSGEKRSVGPTKADRNATIVTSYLAGAEIRELSQQFSLSTVRIREVVLDADCELRSSQADNGKRDLAIVNSYKAGMPTAEIAKQHGLSRARVKQITKGGGCTRGRGRPHKGGADHVAE